DSQLFFGGNDQSTLKYVSDQLGTGTVERVALRNRAMTLERVQVMRSPSPRCLMAPDELRCLDLGKAVLILGGMPPALIDKLDYTEHPLGTVLDQARAEVKVIFPEPQEPPGKTEPLVSSKESRQPLNKEAAASEKNSGAAPPAEESAESAARDKFW
ncbi:MAG: type IV secretory system conjugative DNA transfer family protein, partial [Bacillota bacterium]